MPPPEAEHRRAVVVARPALSSLIALVLRHCALDVLTSATRGAAEEVVRTSGARLLVIEVGRARSTLDLFARTAPDTRTLALVDVDSGVSSVAAFAGGADQVVRIPFTPDELAVRVAALTRLPRAPLRFTRDEPFAGVVLSLDEYVRIGARRIPLRPRSNSLLYLLAANAPRAVARDDVRAFVWGFDRDATDGAIDREARSLSRSLAGALRLTIDPGGISLVPVT